MIINKAIKAILAILISLLTFPTIAADLPKLFQKVNPSVVEIVVKETKIAEEGPAKRVSTGAIGSGFLISEDGLIMTAAHVVQTADKAVVRFFSGETAEAKVISSNPWYDVALIKVHRVPDDIPVAKLGDSDLVKEGEEIFIIGAPLGISHTLTSGIISARRSPENLVDGIKPAELLQTDAAINQGNSGGPMFNMQGEVIGIVSHMISQSGSYEGLGFVVTSNLAKDLLLEEPSMWTGMTGHLLETNLAQLLNLPQDSGIMVQDVAAGSPAARLGLKPGSVRAVIEETELILGGDIILSIQGIRLTSPENFVRAYNAIQGLKENDKISLIVFRNGKTIELSKTLSQLY
jgi:S1-C subfamily serine protease